MGTIFGRNEQVFLDRKQWLADTSECPVLQERVLADAIVGDTETFDVFARIRHLPFPGGILRRPGLTLGMLYYRIRDLLS